MGRLLSSTYIKTSSVCRCFLCLNRLRRVFYAALVLFPVLTCAPRSHLPRFSILVARILLSWFPGVQSNPIVRPLITVCDPYLNLFRQTVPPIFGLDLSPILALLLLQAFGSVSHAVYLLLSWGLFAFDDEEQLTERTDFKNDCMDTGYDCPWCRSRQPESGVSQQEEALHNAKVAAT